MVDITYGPDNPRWDESRKPELVRRLNTLLEYLRVKGELHFERTDAPASKTGFIPYVDGSLIQGVIIRNITKLSIEDENKLRSSSDEVYGFVMGM